MDVGGGPRGRELRQFPESPGRQREQRVPFLTQEHLKHLAVPLQRQQRVEAGGRRAPATLLEVAMNGTDIRMSCSPQPLIAIPC